MCERHVLLARLQQFQAQNQGHKIRKDSKVLMGHAARQQRSFPFSQGLPRKEPKSPTPSREPGGGIRADPPPTHRFLRSLNRKWDPNALHSGERLQKREKGSVSSPHLASSPGMTQRAELLRGAANRQGAGWRTQAEAERGGREGRSEGRWGGRVRIAAPPASGPTPRSRGPNPRTC